MKVYIHNADGYFESVLCKRLNEEHEIYGTYHGQDESRQLLKNVVSTDLPSVKQALIACDVIVYRLTDSIEDAKFAVKVLEAANFLDEKTFILVSNIMSWTNTRKHYTDEGEEQEEEEEETKVEQKGFPKRKEYDAFTEDQSITRKPHPKYKQFLEIEKRVRKATSKTLKTYILFSGIMYGEGEDLLHAYFKLGWMGNSKSLPVFLDGGNYVPMIHVKDLSNIVAKIIDEPPATEEEGETAGAGQYIFGVDESQVTLKDIVVALSNEFLGTDKVHHLNQSECLLHENADQFMVDLKMQIGLTDNLTDLEWHSREGIVEKIKEVREEYEKVRNLSPLKLCVLGPPASGKTQLSSRLSKQYKINHIKVENVIKEFFADKARLTDELDNIEREKRERKEKLKLENEKKKEKQASETSAEDGQDEEDQEQDEEEGGAEEEEKEEEEEEEGDEESPSAIINKKLKFINRVEKMKDAQGRLNDKALTKIYKWKLNQNVCKNQGWILDGYPKTVAQAKLLMVKLDEEEEPEEEEEEAEPEQEEEKEAEPEEDNPDQKADPTFLPNFMLRFVVNNDVLEQRLMSNNKNNENSHDNEEGLKRRLALWEKNGEELVSWIETIPTEQGVQCISREVQESSVENTLKNVSDFIGEPHNYGPTKEELEFIKMEEERRKQEEEEELKSQESKRLQLEQLEREEREEITRLDGERLQEILRQEREMLEVKSAPLRNYLMEQVIPTLTKGLIEVCQLRPEDPVDYLAEWLFKNNPANSSNE
ncbi:adenylate kinase [Acrasis kona]|uniref:Adenylate kinase n=1 Tax=Acrasis kona TaxID=1008807 RepID=A0AAW2ZN11_9EUKA